jgi:EAL domain-containing protein (putative c-di-GMP-specific phosphodiesterase class I)
MNMRLLAYDDDAAVGRLVTRVAVMAGMEANAVTLPEAFRLALHDTPPQIVVLDLQLGHTDGIEQLRYLAEEKFAGSLILMSGFDARVLDTTGALARNLGLNVAAMLPKPIRVADLEQVLERVRSADHAPTLAELGSAAREGELTLEFHPVVNRRARTLLRLEAAIRWNHPTLGRVSATAMLSAPNADPQAAADMAGWTVGAVGGAWRTLGQLGVSTQLATRISGQNLQDPELPDWLGDRLKAAGMPADQLWLEVPESAAFQDAERVMDILGRLRLKGVQLEIDGFGTGYSSLRLLRQMPFCAIRIDRSFVADVTTSRDSRTIVKSIIDLAANMEMESVAADVETEAAARLMEELGVGALQGGLIAPPMPADAVPGWLAVWRAM